MFLIRFWWQHKWHEENCCQVTMLKFQNVWVLNNTHFVLVLKSLCQEKVVWLFLFNWLPKYMFKLSISKKFIKCLAQLNILLFKRALLNFLLSVLNNLCSKMSVSSFLSLFISYFQESTIAINCILFWHFN